jgi:hypothetical protein
LSHSFNRELVRTDLFEYHGRLIIVAVCKAVIEYRLVYWKEGWDVTDTDAIGTGWDHLASPSKWLGQCKVGPKLHNIGTGKYKKGLNLPESTKVATFLPSSADGSIIKETPQSAAYLKTVKIKA